MARSNESLLNPLQKFESAGKWKRLLLLDALAEVPPKLLRLKLDKRFDMH